MNDKDSQIINQQITRYLARREHSKVELLQKLLAKGYQKTVCEEQIRYFAEHNLQSDSRYCESFIRGAYTKGKGPRIIRQGLKQHEIDDVIVNQSISSPELDWYELALKVRIKKFSEEIPQDFKLIYKQKSFLQYRGFEQAQIDFAFEKT